MQTRSFPSFHEGESRINVGAGNRAESVAFATDLTVAGQRRTLTGLPPKRNSEVYFFAFRPCLRIRAHAHPHFTYIDQHSTARSQSQRGTAVVQPVLYVTT